MNSSGTAGSPRTSASAPNSSNASGAKRQHIPDSVEGCHVDLGSVEACQPRCQPRRTKVVAPSRLRLASSNEYKLLGGTMSTVGVEAVNRRKFHRHGQMPKEVKGRAPNQPHFIAGRQNNNDSDKGLTGISLGSILRSLEAKVAQAQD